MEEDYHCDVRYPCRPVNFSSIRYLDREATCGNQSMWEVRSAPVVEAPRILVSRVVAFSNC